MNKKIILISVVSGILLLLGIYFTSPYFHVNSIIILGNSKITTEEIESKLNVLLEENTFLTDKKKIKEIYTSDPYIESIEIKSKFPSTLIFNIKKRQAVATVKFSGGFLVIDENAAVLESTQELSKIVKPLISGIEVTQVRLGDKLDIENEDTFNLIHNIITNVRSAKLLNNISQIEISKESEIVMITPQGVNVLLGEGENLNNKMLILNQILIDLHEKKIYSGYIDMRYEGYPVYRRTK
ncbi:cell division protein FtsQ/DivIB [Proteocatella sphenisci]|uniref:cell division protein FtsQ/DivIB n=1 Tax=Proteocatella sphenisci TaxID=181070 RepID=UPI00048FCAF4|nr:FtsQ-type POTRA domain-containing protein [Proteocatella sphenisci]